MVPYSEIAKLNKKIMGMQKLLDEDRVLMLKERKTNNDLREELDRLNRKIKKMEITNEKAEQLDLDYARLLDSFEKSENIRKHQKQLIENLRGEIEFLKRANSGKAKENYEPQRDPSREKERKRTKDAKKIRKGN